jgi:hypothetical protein
VVPPVWGAPGVQAPEEVEVDVELEVDEEVDEDEDDAAPPPPVGRPPPGLESHEPASMAAMASVET